MGKILHILIMVCFEVFVSLSPMTHIRGLKLKVNEILFSLKMGYLFLLFSTTKLRKFLNAAVYQACKCFLRKHGPDTYTKTHT